MPSVLPPKPFAADLALIWSSNVEPSVRARDVAVRQRSIVTETDGLFGHDKRLAAAIRPAAEIRSVVVSARFADGEQQQRDEYERDTGRRG
jgi:hypothetical protein